MRTLISPPAGYHGQSQRGGYFEGWYLKQVDATGQHALAVIPGVSLDPRPDEAHCFIQVLDSARRLAGYHRFPLTAFSARPDTFAVRIGPNSFGLDGFALNLDGPLGRIVGEVHFGPLTPWPVTHASPGAMGPLAYAPRMECYHGVLSFDHALSGGLSLGGERVVWDGGRGYIEKDWGRSFPRAWVWLQSNHFRSAGTSVMASVAVIPWLGATFRGLMIGLWRQGQLLRWASYTGARLERLEVQPEQVTLSVLGGWGATRGLRLELVAQRAQPVELLGPRLGAMSERVPETLSAVVALRLSRARDGETLYADEGQHAGLEVAGEIARLTR